MSDDELPPELNEINGRLAAGLATCRSITANYKSLIAGQDLVSDLNDDRIGSGRTDHDAIDAERNR